MFVKGQGTPKPEKVPELVLKPKYFFLQKNDEILDRIP